jgi:hypothetical protein
MNRTARLQSAKHWLPTYTGRDLVRGYRNWYGVSTVCAIMELRQLGIEVDEQRLIRAKLTEESKAQQRTRIREQVEKLSEDALISFNPDLMTQIVTEFRRRSISKSTSTP